MEFKDLIKNKGVLMALEELGFVNPTKIQEDIIPIALSGIDVLGQSQTGTGKTIAFVLPILENISQNNQIQSLILSPTRELAIQIKSDIDALSKYIDIDSVCVYGKSSIEDQIKKIRKGPEIIIGTPGRIKDLIDRNILNFKMLKFFVLDEADEMLSMGFQKELEYIFSMTQNEKQVMLFSATMPKEILKIAKNYMNTDYKFIEVASKELTAVNIEQEYYVVNNNTRFEALCRLVDYYNPNRSIIFCRTKKNADELLEKCVKRGYSVDIIHGDIIQKTRIVTLDKFKAGLFKFLIATDVAARGIHVNDIDIVFNYNLPESNDAYVHRIGRTGRASKNGMSITLVTKNEEKIIYSIERHINAQIIKKAIPTMETILGEKTNNTIKSITTKEDTTLFNEYIETLSIEEKNNILSKLLYEKLKNDIKSDFSTNIYVEEKNKDKRQLLDTTRVFLTIGKLDKIEKRDFLKFLENTANVKEGTFTKMEIMTKFTFMNVDNKYLDVFLKKCNNITYKKRLIKVEIAKK